MPAVACAACKQKMSSEAAVCPHCGARSAGAPTRLAEVKMSPRELRALVAVDPDLHGREDAPRTPVQAVLVPHPRTHGATRVLEVGLTIACLPLILSGLLPLLLARRLARGRAVELSGEAAAVTTIAVSGGVGLASVLLETSWSLGQILATVGGEIVLLVVRGVVRANASASRELMRLATDEDEDEVRTRTTDD